MVKKKSEPKVETQEVPKVEQKHKCEVCGEDAVCLDSPSTMKDTNHWYCYEHHMMWCKCLTHEKMVKEFELRKK